MKLGRIVSTRGAQRGQGMSEYIVIVALIALSAIAVIGAFGEAIQSQFVQMANALTGNATTQTTVTDNSAPGTMDASGW